MTPRPTTPRLPWLVAAVALVAIVARATTGGGVGVHSLGKVGELYLPGRTPSGRASSAASPLERDDDAPVVIARSAPSSARGNRARAEGGDGDVDATASSGGGGGRSEAREEALAATTAAAAAAADEDEDDDDDDDDDARASSSDDDASRSPAGAYADPNHPGCPRAVALVSKRALNVTGADGTPGCARGETRTAWALRGTWRTRRRRRRRARVDEIEVDVDFSPKGGPSALKGKVTSEGIAWEDGNAWRRIVDGGGAEVDDARETPPSDAEKRSDETPPPPGRTKNVRNDAADASTARRFVAYTWGIGGARVGRPSDPSATPPGVAEFEDAASASVVAAAASGHTALVTSAGDLYTCGRNDSRGGGGRGSPPIDDAGQLGRGGPMDVFAKVRAFELGDADAAAPGKVLKDRRSPRERGRMGTSVAPPPRFVDVAAGRYHTAAATDDGRAFTFGLNDRGQLGREGVVGVATPGAGCVEDSGGSAGACEDAGGADAIPRDRCRGGGACRSGVAGVVAGGALSGSGPDVRVVKVAAGRYSTAVVTESGGVVVWGLNACGGGGGDGDAAAAPTPAALLADPKSASTPRALGRNLFGQDAEDGDKAVDVAVGYLHVVIATASGKVYTCATGFDGYAGVREGFELNDDDASSRGGGVSRKSSAAAVPSSSAGGGVFAELGRPARDASEALRPARVLGALTRAKVVSVAAGRCHAAAATEDGDAFFFGCGGDRGVGGTNGSSTDADAAAGAPRRLTHPASLPTSSTKITSVAAGEYFTLAATADGAVLGWGDDASGQLGGFGGVGGRDATAPTLVEMARRRGGDGGGADVRTRRVVAGYQHAVAIAEEAERT